MKNTIKKIIPTGARAYVRALLDVALLLYGLIVYKSLKIRVNDAYLSFIRIFCRTSGASNEFISYLISCFRKPYLIKEASGILGDLDENAINEITREIEEKGYYVFNHLMPKHICDSILNYALTKDSTILPSDGEDESHTRKSIYNREAPEATIYSFDIQDTVNVPEIQNLIADPSILAITQSYLKSKVYFDQCMLWWSTAYKSKPDISAAQLFHFDMDRVKWLKIFVYLTDVTSETGPHTFISGSHRVKGIPKQLLKKGYSRLTDEEVYPYYNKDEIINFKGPIGTIIIEDTRGLHKGTHVKKGDRLILELQYSNSLFGATLPEAKFASFTPNLEQSVSLYPKVFSSYL